MLTPPPGLKVLVATKPIDFRKGADGLAVLAQEVVKQSPSCGICFLFRGKRADRIKILWPGDGTGLMPVQQLSGFILHLLRLKTGALIAAARSASRSHRLQCLTGGFGPGASYRYAWPL